MEESRLIETSASKSRPRRRRLRLSLRSLMVLVLVVGGLLGWKARRASIQRRAVAQIKAAGGTLLYDYQVLPTGGFQPAASPWAPRWLRDWLGDELFQEVAIVWLENPKNAPARVNADHLAALLNFDQLRRLFIFYVPLNDAAVAPLTTLNNLKELTLLDIKISERSLTLIRRMPKLTHLSLRVEDGYLQGSSLQCLAGWDQLEKLELFYLNSISVADLAPIRTMTGLRSLRLILSPKDGSSLSSLGGLDKLTLIDFRQTMATDHDLAVLASLPQLSSLLLDGSKISDAGLGHLARIPSLTSLYLESPDQPGGITDAGLVQLGRLPKLSTLSISGANLTESGFESLETTPLTILSLSGLEAKQEGLVRSLANRPLQNLGLSGEGVTDNWLRPLAHPSSSVSNLNLDRTRITDSGMVLLGQFPKLTYLSLDGTALTDAGLVLLGASGSLRFVSALGTKVTESGIARLRAIRPSIRVEVGPIVPLPRHRSVQGN